MTPMKGTAAVLGLLIIPTTKRIRTTLLRSDFVATNRDFDPNQPGFHPADHVRQEDGGAKKP